MVMTVNIPVICQICTHYCVYKLIDCDNRNYSSIPFTLEAW